MNGYKSYLEMWFAGLKDEIIFWKKHIENQGNNLFYRWESAISPMKKFMLESDIPIDKLGKVYKFADIGSGPFSRCGRVTDKVQLKEVHVDPLAYVYEVLKEKNSIDNGINVQTGFVELLDQKFKENTFDMVHMSNSLDHCFDAIFGIYQLLYICNVGGRVVLRHHENEAENENYVGLHQWNLSLNNLEHTFIIWRGNVRYDVCEIFKEYADIELYPNEKEDGWEYNKVVMKKKKNISIPENHYNENMLNFIYEYLLQMFLNEECLEVVETYMDKICKDIRKIYFEPEIFKKNLRENGIDTVAIYGMGEIGKLVIHLFNKCEIEITAVIDKRELEYEGIKSVRLESFDVEKVSTIIIAVKEERDEIKKQLKEKINSQLPILHIEELIKIYS